MTTQLARPTAPPGDPGAAAARDLVAAIAARDFRGMRDLLGRDVRFRYLVPRGPGELLGATDVVAKFTDWFGGRDTVRLEALLVDRVADRTSARYRLDVRDADGRKAIEQQVYLDVDPEGRVGRLDLLCSGFRLVEPAPDATAAGSGATAATPGVHHFDAGQLGCADGLADEVRRRLAVIPVGDALEVVARDPAAREDLPPLARMLGHTLRSTERSADGATTFTIERTR